MEVERVSVVDDSEDVFEVFVFLTIERAVLAFVENGVSASKRARESAFSSKGTHFVEPIAIVVFISSGNVFTPDATVAEVSAEYLGC